LGLYDKAAVAHERAVFVRRSSLGPDHPDTLISRNDLAEAYGAAGRTAEALALHEQTLQLREAKLGPDHPDTLTSRNNVARTYQQAGDEARAEPLFHRTLELQEKKLGGEDPQVAGTLANLGRCLLHQGRHAEAEPLLRRCLAIREERLADDWTRFNAMSLLGASLTGQKRYTEAEPFSVRGYEGMKTCEAKIPPLGKAHLTEAAERIVALYDAWEKPGEAASWRAKLGLPPVELPADVFAP
jgi:eukaryotic-like serine/threonine-protein kinase